jgi:hypothetical protein
MYVVLVLLCYSVQVKDLEVELEATKKKDKEILHQAVLTEREKITQLQWDKDELYRKYSEMESNLKIEQVGFPLCLLFVIMAWFLTIHLTSIFLHFFLLNCRMRKLVCSQRKQLLAVKKKCYWKS